MTKKDIIKEYSNGDFTVVWKPQKCIHAAECVKRLPQVYDPNKKPWINAENASVKELTEQIDACPSGALSYKKPKDDVIDSLQSEIKIDALKNGPLLVHGSLRITTSDGKQDLKNKATAFCRCGESKNKPYCDGAHKNSGFLG